MPLVPGDVCKLRNGFNVYTTSITNVGMIVKSGTITFSNSSQTHWTYWVLFDNIIKGPYFTGELELISTNDAN